MSSLMIIYNKAKEQATTCANDTHLFEIDFYY